MRVKRYATERLHIHLFGVSHTNLPEELDTNCPMLAQTSESVRNAKMFIKVEFVKRNLVNC